MHFLVCVSYDDFSRVDLLFGDAEVFEFDKFCVVVGTLEDALELPLCCPYSLP